MSKLKFRPLKSVLFQVEGGLGEVGGAAEVAPVVLVGAEGERARPSDWSRHFCSGGGRNLRGKTRRLFSGRRRCPVKRLRERSRCACRSFCWISDSRRLDRRSGGR